MTDGHDEESDGKVTQILAAVDGPPSTDDQGTLEMDQKAIFARLSPAARAQLVEDDVDDVPATLQLPAIDASTRPQVVVEDRTRSYEVPANLIAELRESSEPELLDVAMELVDDDETTSTFTGAQLGQFVATIDGDGRVEIPQRYLQNAFPPGTRVNVVLRAFKDR